jgi:hypothetical protein
MFEVYLLVAIAVFTLAGTVLMTLIALTWAKEYIRTRLMARHTVAAAAGGRLTAPLRQSL